MATTGPTGRPDSQINAIASLSYWSTVSASVDGMLGGYPQVSVIDLRGSRTFLSKLLRSQKGVSNDDPAQRLRLVVDCGAGIGRITEGLLRDVADVVDVVEPVEKFADAIREKGRKWAEEERVLRGAKGRRKESVSGEQKGKGKGGGAGKRRRKTSADSFGADEPASPLGNDEPDQAKSGATSKGRLGAVHATGLESWNPDPAKKYDLIWNQWCLGHLTDSALVFYLQRCSKALSTDPPGWIVVKENISTKTSSTSANARNLSRESTKGDMARDEVNEGWAEEEDEYDELDSSVTRGERNYKRIFAEAGLRIVREETQRGFPRYVLIKFLLPKSIRASFGANRCLPENLGCTR